MNNAKDVLRKALLENRQSLSLDERKEKSNQISEKLEGLLIEKAVHKVHIFESVEILAEVDTRKFIDYLKQTKPEWSLFYPRKVDGKWRDVDDSNNEAKDVRFDAVIVPTLGFDNFLNRLGYGGGYYDKFLSTQKQAVTIGLCFEAGHVGKVPKESHDVVLNYVITEKQVYTKV